MNTDLLFILTNLACISALSNCFINMRLKIVWKVQFPQNYVMTIMDFLLKILPLKKNKAQKMYYSTFHEL